MPRAMSPILRRPVASKVFEVDTPSPYKGINTVDPLSAMDPAYGISIQNFVATPQGLSVREGYRKWATGLPTTTTSLLPYTGADASLNKLFAVSGTAIYDITSGGAVGTPVVTGLNSGAPWWEHAMAKTVAGSFLMTVNGIDYPRIFNGTTWTTCSQATTPTSPGQFATNDVNGNAVDIRTFNDVILHQRRLWFVSANSTIAYYAGIDALGGALTPFDFGPVLPRGGKLWKLTSWSVNLGATSGIQPNLIAISDRGDVTLYGGSDPDVNWALEATYILGAPVGRRCTMALAGDMLYLSRDGLYPLSQYIVAGNDNTQIAVTTKISPTIADLVSTFATTPGFEMVSYPGSNVVLLNVPQSSSSGNYQFCFHTVTNGWTQFTGWAASSWGLFNNALYFGGSDFVALAFIGYKDGADISGNGGDNIVATALSAFTNMSAQTGRSQLMQVKQVKPYVGTGTSNPTIRIGVNTDFNLVPIIGSATVNPATGAVWDVSIWDASTTTWVGSLATFNQWATPVSYPGEYVAFAISISATDQTMWYSTKWLIEPGGQQG